MRRRWPGARGTVSGACGARGWWGGGTWGAGRGDRIGIAGVNGAGKSTLLKRLVDQVHPATGVVKVGQTVKVAYLSQEVAELDPMLRVLEAVEEVAKQVDLGRNPVGAPSLRDRFRFTRDPQWTRVRDLAGGQRRRLPPLRLPRAQPNHLRPGAPPTPRHRAPPHRL